MIVSMDAIFGLPRKLAAGKSVRAPLHGDVFFCDQSMVDEYVENASKRKSTSASIKVFTVCIAKECLHIRNCIGVQ